MGTFYFHSVEDIISSTAETMMKFIALVALLPFVLVECPEYEPVECKGADLLCGGFPDDEGCISQEWCMPVNPYERCSARASCPMECQSGDMKCPGPLDADGCPMPDTCEWVDPHCPFNCPVR